MRKKSRASRPSSRRFFRGEVASERPGEEEDVDSIAFRKTRESDVDTAYLLCVRPQMMEAVESLASEIVRRSAAKYRDTFLAVHSRHSAGKGGETLLGGW